MTLASAFLAGLLAAAAPAAVDLSGFWSPGGGILVEVRQTGAEVWAVSVEGHWAFHGQVAGGRLQGSRVDLAETPFKTSALTLEVLAPDRLVAKGAGAAPVKWTKQAIPKGATTLTWTSNYTGTFPGAPCAIVWCPPGGQPGSLWGSEVYTGDSSICTAAVHSGLFTLAQGGAATVQALAGQQSHQGSEHHGIASSSWEAYTTSFTFAKQCDPNQPRPDPSLDKPMLATGSTTAAAAQLFKRTVWYRCPANVVPSTVWGTGPYTDDSSVCGAAIHAGVVDPRSGGLVGIDHAGPKPKLEGSKQNGVETKPYGPWPRTFKVVPAPAEKPQ